MALGYQGLVLLDDKLFLVTDGNLDHVRPELVSEGTYAAKEASTAVNRVHVFDLDEINGGFNFDTNMELIDQLFHKTNGWVIKRDESLPLLWYSNINNNYEFGDAYWTRISLSAGSGNMTTTSIDMTMIPGANPDSTTPDRYELPTRQLQLADNYIDQRFGLQSGGSEQLRENVSFAAPDNQLPIPYWQTSIEFKDKNGDGLPDGIHVLNWSIEIVNNISRRNLCSAINNTNDHPGPSLIQVGMASVTLNITFVTVVTLDDTGTPITEFNMPERFNDVIIKLENNSLTRNISLGRLDGTTDGNDFSSPVQETSDASNLSGVGALQEMNYIAQGYFTMPHLET